MRKSIIKNVTIEYSFYIFAATILLLVPLRLALAWIFAIVIHELCHYLVLKACMVPILSVSISAAGIKMDTENIKKVIEAIITDPSITTKELATVANLSTSRIAIILKELKRLVITKHIVLQ